jgi:acetyl-CoA carboxylase carboxyl transferase subunit alpha
LPGEAERGLRERLSRLKGLPLLHRTGVSGEDERLRSQLESLAAAGANEDEIWAVVELARHQERPYTLDYVERMIEDWVELHGDRGRADDGAIVAGIGRLDGRMSPSSATRRAATSRSGSAASTGWRTPRATPRRSGCSTWRSASSSVLTLIDTLGAHPGPQPSSTVRVGRSPARRRGWSRCACRRLPV